jgi:photosystem II stability/assembly factor-like uncharacterized protein
MKSVKLYHFFIIIFVVLILNSCGTGENKSNIFNPNIQMEIIGKSTIEIKNIESYKVIEYNGQESMDISNKVLFTSSNESILQYSTKNRYFIAESAGNATITAKYKNKISAINVNIIENKFLVIDINGNLSQLNLKLKKESIYGEIESFEFKARLKSIKNFFDYNLILAEGDFFLKNDSNNDWSILKNNGSYYNINDFISNEDNKTISVGDDGVILISYDNINWESVNSNTKNNLHAIIMDRYQMISIGDKGTILNSKDQKTWSIIKSGTTKNLYSIALNNNCIVAVGESGVILASINHGISWESDISITQNNLYSIASNESRFVAIGDNGTIITSTDCINWESGVYKNTERLNSITTQDFNENNFIAVGDHGTILDSKGGIIWEQVDSGTSNNLYGISSSANNFGGLIVVGANSTLLTSDDAINWKSVNIKPSIKFNGVVENNSNKFFSVDTKGNIFTFDKDWNNFKLAQFYTTNSFNNININKNGKIVAVGVTNIVISNDGINWESARCDPITNFYSVAINNKGQFVTIGSTNIIVSTDGISCKYIKLQNYNSLNSVTVNNEGKFVIVGDNGTILTSTDLINWKSTKFGNQSLQSITVNNDGKFVIVDDVGNILVSNDAITWQLINLKIDDLIVNITVNGANRFIAGGYAGIIITSTDGINWSIVNDIPSDQYTTRLYPYF